MRFLFPFLLILLSLGVMAQETPADSESGAEVAPQVEEDEAEDEPEAQPATKSKQGDFKPSQEISEDYPVPLPADI